MDNVCFLTVRTSSGGPAWGVKVSTEVSGGISCIGGRKFSTNRDGEVELRWTKGCYLRKIYIDGRGYDVNYQDGGRYVERM